MIEVRSPVDGRLLGTVPDESAEAVRAAVDALRAQQPEWEALGPRGRARWLRRFRDWLLDHSARIADVIQAESGKPRAEAVLEVPAVAETINYFGARAEKFLDPQRVPVSSVLNAAKRLRVRYRPHPVTGIVTAWNFPVLGPGFDLVPALLAGSAVLLKPSEATPLAARELASGWAEIGAPAVFTVRTGAAETGQALVDHVDFVQFTGSTTTGKLVARRAIERMVPYSLELGGKDPAIVLADADLDRAVPGIAWGALFNSGQACVAVERVYVEEPVYDEFVARLADYVTALRPGRDLGPLITPAQRDIVAQHIADAVARGAKAQPGEHPATVLAGADHTMDAVREETFGPVIPVMKVADADEAVRLANDSSYGLSASVWTRDRSRAEQLAARLEAGAVNINDVVANLLAPGLPHGGWKHSGSGSRFGGAYGLRKYCREQAITTPRLPTPKRLPMWFPYTPAKTALLSRILNIVAGRSLRYGGRSDNRRFVARLVTGCVFIARPRPGSSWRLRGPVRRRRWPRTSGPSVR